MLGNIRYAFRILSQNPGFAAVAILSLALGIGANTAIFTLIDTVLLRSLPVQAPEQLVVIARNPANPSTSFNYPDYEYVRDQNRRRGRGREIFRSAHGRGEHDLRGELEAGRRGAARYASVPPPTPSAWSRRCGTRWLQSIRRFRCCRP
jgi:hypothetical protein